MEDSGNLFSDAVAWLSIEANQGLTLVIIAILGAIGTFLAWFFGLFKRKPDLPPVVVQQPPPIVPGSAGTITLTLEAYEARIQERANEIAAQMLNATWEERDRLIAAKSDLEKRLANIDTAISDTKTNIAELEITLSRFGNEIGGDRLAEARNALEVGDFSNADEIFAEVQAREKVAVQRAAEAAFGQGQIAEEQVRWADAAEHYSRAAGLEPSYDALIKARVFAWRAGDNTRAAGLGEELIRVAGDKFGDESAELATALNEHALTIRALGRYSDAEPLYRHALEIGEKTIGTVHPDYAARLNNLALLLHDMRRDEEAEPLYRQALEIVEKTIGTEHPDYAVSLSNLGMLLHAMERYAEAEPLYQQALEIDAKTIGTIHPQYAKHLNNLAALLQAKGSNDEAEPLFRQVLEIDAKTIGTKHPSYAINLNNLAATLRAKGRTDEAELLLRQALEIDEKTVGKAHPDYAVHLNNLAGLLRDMGRYGEAEPLYVEALEVSRNALGDEHQYTRKIAAIYAIFLRAHFPDDPALAELEAAFGPDIGR